MEDVLAEFRRNKFVFPDYKNSNLAAIRETVAQKGHRTGDKPNKIFLVVDGLGFNLISDLLASEKRNSALGSAKVEEISTVFPSTTTAVMNSLESGQTPAEHGVIGWDVYQKELGTVVTPYRDAPAFTKSMRLSADGVRSLLPKPALLEKAAGTGRIGIVYPEGIVMGDEIEGASQVQYYTSTDMFIQLRKAVSKGGEWFLYAYYDGIDHLEHKYGYTSESVKQSVLAFFGELDRLLLPQLKRSDYNLIITADHGQIEAKRVLVRSDDRMMDYLVMPPWGDSRTLCVNVWPGKERAFRRFFEAEYGKDAVLLDSDSLIATGVFGKDHVTPEIRHRFGTHMILMKEDKAMKYDYPTKSSKHELFGVHSGLSKREMRVPLIVY
ncbi:MAG: alkaline phosphatase family protein [Candidatus Micrarchaeota archaeon]|nr:alkaline phosphatase family protein [Candidatus Micrarchaeota archaeon]